VAEAEREMRGGIRTRRRAPPRKRTKRIGRGGVVSAGGRGRRQGDDREWLWAGSWRGSP
jgi:hypothetical protein